MPDPTAATGVDGQVSLGEELAADGMSAARAAATTRVRQAVDQAIATLARTRTTPFAADDVHALLALEGIDLTRQPLSGSPNMLGAAFRKALADRVIAPVGFRPSTRASRHGGIVRTYLAPRRRS